MTFFHFANCVALAYIPYLIIYKSSGLAEYSAFWKCVQASAAYLVTQLCKMMFLATFFPATDHVTGHFDFVGEFLKATVDITDLFGLYLVMSQITGKGQLKFMIAGVGWSFAELLTTGFFPLWIGARGVEFDWKYIHMSFMANINMVQHIVTAMLVWLYTRSDLNKAQLPAVFGLLGLSCFRTFIIEFLAQVFGAGLWLILAKILMTFLSGIIALKIYATLPSVKM
ncbi:hypothetical protein HELRODRAFT_108721 [Helobdella robusta]|uniref:BOS complex subunit TMEM147 n=1 Tax=Helobdella robusta TaxID=6412 RepID=T1EEL8_HELRO|nr:hypothetical protein HELRODRAFT_108721 [Helobdella robusta]ESN90656.1 hypothetical protein HELRODRAFT_108721 [Helobdella robusta]